MGRQAERGRIKTQRRRLSALLAEAERAANDRGHRLKAWSENVMGTTASSACLRCHRLVHVDASPPPNGIDIAGEAVALDCEPYTGQGVDREPWCELGGHPLTARPTDGCHRTGVA